MVLICTFWHQISQKVCIWTMREKNDVQNVHRQPAHKLINDNATVLHKQHFH